MQISALDSYQHSNNTTILCIWAWEAVCMKAVTNKELKRKKTVLTWCSIFYWKKARNNVRPPETTKLQRRARLSVLDPTFRCFC